MPEKQDTGDSAPPRAQHYRRKVNEDIHIESRGENSEAGNGRKKRGRNKTVSVVSEDEACSHKRTNPEILMPKIDRSQFNCHQCKRNDKGRVVRCNNQNCSKRFCIKCLKQWYPKMTEEEVAKACPVCLRNCNCKACLRLESVMRAMKDTGLETSKEEELRHAKYLVRALLPYLKQLDEEQKKEITFEAQIQGVAITELEIPNANCPEDERIFCDNCKTSIFDYHRNCSNCSCDLCLTCCGEIREVYQCSGDPDVVVKHTDSSHANSHGGEGDYNLTVEVDAKMNGVLKSKPEWKANNDGRILCHCGFGTLDLKYLFCQKDEVSELLEKAHDIAKRDELDMSKACAGRCACFNSNGDFNVSNSNLLKVASRGDSDDNYLFYPRAKDIEEKVLKHFQFHLKRGEPVVVNNVLETASGLSWDPMVMWRAFRQVKDGRRDSLLDVSTIDCSNFCPVDINIHRFFIGYSKGRRDLEDCPEILKLVDWPPSKHFGEVLPRHEAEFLLVLPFKEYTHQ